MDKRLREMNAKVHGALYGKGGGSGRRRNDNDIVFTNFHEDDGFRYIDRPPPDPAEVARQRALNEVKERYAPFSGPGAPVWGGRQADPTGRHTLYWTWTEGASSSRRPPSAPGRFSTTRPR